MLMFLLSRTSDPNTHLFFLAHIWIYSVKIVNFYLISSFFIYLFELEQV